MSGFNAQIQRSLLSLLRILAMLLYWREILCHFDSTLTQLAVSCNGDLLRQIASIARGRCWAKRFFVGFLKDGLLAELQARTSRGCCFLLFLPYNQQVSLKLLFHIFPCTKKYYPVPEALFHKVQEAVPGGPKGLKRFRIFF